MVQDKSTGDELAKSWLTILIIWAVLVTLVKAVLTARLELFGDEVFYWLESLHPAWAYEDHPFLTASMIAAGTRLFGHTPFGIRSLFLLLSLALPFAVYWLGRPVIGKRHAGLGALLIFLVPVPATLGVLALPDVPLILWAVLALGMFERALRLGGRLYWLLAGLFAALGLCTHYRFLFVICAALLYLVLTRQGRAQWQQPGLWVAAGVMLLGLLPLAVFNLQNDLSGIRYFFLDRHPWQFHPAGLLYLFEQAAVAGPLLFIAFIHALLQQAREALRAGFQPGLLALFSGFYLVLFTLLKPVADQDMVSLHWTLPAYFILPLLTAPGLFSPGRPAWVRGLVLGSGLAWVAGTLLFLLATAFHAQLPPRWQGYAAKSMVGWEAMAQRADELLRSGEIVVADNYYPAAYLLFYSERQPKTYTIGTYRERKHGRLRQLGWWEMDARALQARAADPALVVIQRSYLNDSGYRLVMAHLCTLYPHLQRVDELAVAGGRRVFQYYRSRPEEGFGGTACDSQG